MDLIITDLVLFTSIENSKFLSSNLNENYKNKSIIIKSNRQQYYIDLQTRRIVKTIIYTKSHIYSDMHIYTAGAVSIYTLPDR